MTPSCLPSDGASTKTRGNHYLPFTALGNVLASKTTNTVLLPVSPARAALVFAVDIAIGWIVAWMLFLRRDASS